MSRLVMKFGGTSVADLERIRRVGRLVAAEVAAGHRVAVVVSAMAGKTNELVAWTDAAGPAADGLPASDDEYDVVVASGARRGRPDVPGADLPHVLSGDTLRALITGEAGADTSSLGLFARSAVAVGRRLGFLNSPQRIRELSRRWMPVGLWP